MARCRLLALSFLFLVAMLAGCAGPAATPTASPVVRPLGAADTFHMSMGEGLKYSEDKWKSLVNNCSIFWAMGSEDDFFDVEVEIAERVHWLSDQGMKINYRVWWWNLFAPPEEQHNALDIYYDEPYRQEVQRIIDNHFKNINPEKLWALTLSEEEPANAYRWALDADPLPQDIAKYGATYYRETGFELKPVSQMNETEGEVFFEWLNNKNVWVFNYIYDYVKSKWPHLIVFQSVYARPLPWSYCEPYELKADGFMIGSYSDNPWDIYHVVRHYKTMFPEKPVHVTLLGNQVEGESEADVFERIREHAWIAYLAGADGIGWFMHHESPPGVNHGEWGWYRSDELGQRLYLYINQLNRELMKLPVVKLQPQVLAIGHYDFAELGVFTQYDTVSQRCFAKTDLDLSQYKLIVIFAPRFYEETVLKLNDFVRAGGNVIFLGGTGYGYRNMLDTSTRENRFLLEDGAPISFLGGHVEIDITEPNLLGINLQYEDWFHYSLTLYPEALDETYHPVGDFWQIDEDDARSKPEGYPLLLYHEGTEPTKGWMLYWGLQTSSRSPETTWNNYDEVDLRFLHRETSQAFAVNLLDLEGSIATEEREGLVITESKLRSGDVFLGIQNTSTQSRAFSYSLDLERFGLAGGKYWVHSINEDLALGDFESEGIQLRFDMSLDGKAVKMLVISSSELEPPYSVDTSPPIPSPGP